MGIIAIVKKVNWDKKKQEKNNDLSGTTKSILQRCAKRRLLSDCLPYLPGCISGVDGNIEEKECSARDCFYPINRSIFGD